MLLQENLVVVADYWVITSTVCQASDCAVGDYGHSSSICLVTNADSLANYTSYLFGAEQLYAHVKFWNTPVCNEELSRVTHYKINTCVHSSSKGDNSQSYQLLYDASANSLRNARYTDSNCAFENQTASFPVLLNETDCSSGPMFGQYYSASIQTTISETTDPNSPNSGGPNIGAIVGGVVGAVFFLGIIVFLYLYRSKAIKRYDARGVELNGPLQLAMQQQQQQQQHQQQNQPLNRHSFFSRLATERRFRPISLVSSNNLSDAEFLQHQQQQAGNNSPSLFSTPPPQVYIANNINGPIRTFTDTSTAVFSSISEAPTTNNSSVDQKQSIFAVMDSTSQQSLEGNRRQSAISTHEIARERLLLVDQKFSPYPQNWDCGDAARWVALHGGGGDYKSVMESEEIDGRALLVISVDVLCGVLGITSVGRKAKIADAVRRLKFVASSEGGASDGGVFTDDNNNEERGREDDGGMVPPPAYETTSRQVEEREMNSNFDETEAEN
ncbi:hypothetical protein HK100_001097 [Physocladia obscura]|uniref:SAM domain-containing protein n=1 Tax=Physocladia obscura TaxID=109957 RepID=A0AAD5XER8_9FUNG|nr:hypothetical protein HK100_001097 [Physocladia obscura]